MSQFAGLSIGARGQTRAPIAEKRPAPSIVRFLPMIATAAILAVSVAALNWLEIDWEAISSLGYGGLFLVNLVASATVALPLPGIVPVFLAGGVLDPVMVGLSAGAGAAIGELSGYVVGSSARSAIGRSTGSSSRTARIYSWVHRFGFWAILCFALIPNPVFDMAGMAAGAAKMSIKKFLLAVLIGKVAKMFLIALAGSYGLTWVMGQF